MFEYIFQAQLEILVRMPKIVLKKVVLQMMKIKVKYLGRSDFMFFC